MAFNGSPDKRDALLCLDVGDGAAGRENLKYFGILLRDNWSRRSQVELE